MKLPSSREEFTMFAIEYSNQKFWRKAEESNLLYKHLEQWIQKTYTEFPDLVEHKKTHDGDVCIIIANVEIITLWLCSENMRTKAVRYHFSKYGEFL